MHGVGGGGVVEAVVAFAFLQQLFVGEADK